MFVIVKCRNNLKKQGKWASIAVKLWNVQTMEHKAVLKSEVTLLADTEQT